MGNFAEDRVAVVIEDETDIRHLLETVLTQAGFQVIATSNGLDGVAAVRRYEPMVTTLDVNMPGMDGFEAARRIREFSGTYIIMLTALNEEIDTLQGLEAGADDYVNKPFRPRELRARIDAMLRRPRAGRQGAADIAGAPVSVPSPAQRIGFAPDYAQAAPQQPMYPQQPFEPVPQQQYPAPVQPAPYPVQAPQAFVAAPVVAAPAPPAAPPQVAGSEPSQTGSVSAAPAPVESGAEERTATMSTEGEGWLGHNGLAANVETREVVRDGKHLELTRSEFDLLVALLTSGRRVRTKPDLVLMLRNESYVTTHFISEADTRAIEVHMANLRKKLGENIVTPRWIETVRGVGYRLTTRDT